MYPIRTASIQVISPRIVAMGACLCAMYSSSMAYQGSALLEENPSALIGDAMNEVSIGRSTPVHSYWGDTQLTYQRPGISPNLRLPFIRKVPDREPHSDVQFGPFFLDFTSWDNSVLVTDNIDRVAPDSVIDEKTDVLGASVLRTQLRTEVGRAFAFTMSGAFVYLPFQNRVGVSGFGLAAPYQGRLNMDPIFNTRINYQENFGHWEFEFVNDFSVDTQNGLSVGGRGREELWEPLSFDSMDRAGRYSFGTGGLSSTAQEPSSEARIDPNDLRYTNLTAVTARRLMPMQMMLEASAYHREYWYDRVERSDIRYEEGVTVSAKEQRENMRFKPFAIYKYARTNMMDKAESFQVGVEGPLSEYTRMTVAGGVSETKSSAALDAQRNNTFRFALVNDLNARLTHGIGYEKSVTDLVDDEIRTTWFYELYKIINGNLNYAMRLSFSDSENIVNPSQSRKTQYWGNVLSYDLSKRGNIRLTQYIEENEYVSNPAQDFDRAVFDVAYTRKLSEKNTLTAIYRNERRASQQLTNNYKENSFFLNLNTRL